jgi:hypothetical protein
MFGGRVVSFFLIAVCPGSADQVAERVFPVTRAQTAQHLNEIAMVMRTVARIKQVAVNEEQKAVTVRATPDQILTAEWLVSALDQLSTVTPEFRVPGTPDDSVRVFYLTHAQTSQDLQEMVTLIRSLADAQYVYVCTLPKAIVLRGNAWRIALADWLVSELNQPPQTLPPTTRREFRLPGGNDILPPEDVFVRVFYTRARTPEDLSNLLAGVRSSVRMIPRSCTHTARRAIVVRASSAKIAAAEQALKSSHEMQLSRP